MKSFTQFLKESNYQLPITGKFYNIVYLTYRDNDPRVTRFLENPKEPSFLLKHLIRKHEDGDIGDIVSKIGETNDMVLKMGLYVLLWNHHRGYVSLWKSV